MSSRRSACVAAFVFWCCPVATQAADVPAEWVIWFQDNFEDGTLRRWRVGIDQAAPGANWALEKDGDNTVMAGRGHIFATALPVTGSNYRFKARVKLIRGFLHMNVRDRCTRYNVRFDANNVSLTRTAPCGQHTQVRIVHEPFGLDKWHVLEIVAVDDEIKVQVNGAEKITFKDETPVMYGSVNFEQLDGGYAQVDDVEVTGPPRTGPGLQIVDYRLPDGGVGVAYNHQLTATGGTPPYKWSLMEGAAPAGLALSEDGLVSGKPEQNGWQPVTVAAVDAEGHRAIEGLGLNITEQFIVNAPMLPPGEVGKEYSVRMEISGMPEGYQWLGLNLPPGLRLDPSTGVLSGVPAVGGAYLPFVVCLAEDDVETKSFGFHARETNPAPLAFVMRPEELWDVVVGEGDPSGEIMATGGTPPYKWAMVDGSLPPGMRLVPGSATSESGPIGVVVGGTAMSAGRHEFTVEVTDSAETKVQQKFEIEASWLGVEADLDDDVILLGMGQPVEIKMIVSNAIGQTKWEAVSLPAGLTLGEDGVLNGALRECGMLSMTLKVSDSGEPPSSRRFGAPIFGMCTADSFALLDINVQSSVIEATLGEPFELKIGVASGSGQGYELKVAEGSLPPGMELRFGSLPGAFILTGTPTETGLFEAYMRANDSAGTVGLRRLRILVEQAP